MISPCYLPTNCPTFTACPGDTTFKSVHVIPRTTGGTLVAWTIGQTQLTGTLSFQLEVGRAGHNHATDWEVVVPFTPNTFYAVDPARRAAGWYQKTYYRVVVSGTGGPPIASVPISANQGRFNPGQKRLYDEIIRRETKRNLLRDTPTSHGYLLKVKYYGDRCTRCMDPDSGEPTDDKCPVCYGVGYQRGYHEPYPCFNVDLTASEHHLSMYKEQGPMIEGGVGSIRYLNVPPVHPWDVWVDGQSDYRYLIGYIKPLASFGDIHVLCRAAAARLALDHPVYSIDVTSSPETRYLA